MVLSILFLPTVRVHAGRTGEAIGLPKDTVEKVSAALFHTLLQGVHEDAVVSVAPCVKLDLSAELPNPEVMVVEALTATLLRRNPWLADGVLL